MAAHNLLERLAQMCEPYGGKVLAWGNTVPSDNALGYAKGCLWVKTNTTGAAAALYVNIGTIAACDFDAIGTAPGSIALAQAKLLVGSAGGAAVAQTLGGDATIDASGVLTLASAAQPVVFPLNKVVQAAAMKDALPDTPNGTTLGLADAAGSAVVGTTTNGNGTAAASETCAFDVPLPDNYVAGAAITLRLRAKVSATRQVAQTIDAVVKAAADGALGSDICATAVQTLTTSYANYDFTITPTNLVAGDVLNVVVTLATDDTAGSVNGYAALSKASIRPTVKV